MLMLDKMVSMIGLQSLQPQYSIVGFLGAISTTMNEAFSLEKSFTYMLDSYQSRDRYDAFGIEAEEKCWNALRGFALYVNMTGFSGQC